jgi:hypothetical protein
MSYKHVYVIVCHTLFRKERFSSPKCCSIFVGVDTFGYKNPRGSSHIKPGNDLKRSVALPWDRVNVGCRLYARHRQVVDYSFLYILGAPEILFFL